MPLCGRNCSCTCSIMGFTLAIKSLATSQCPWAVRNSIASCRSGRVSYIRCGKSQPVPSMGTHSRLQIQHAPLPMWHAPAEEVTVHGADMLARSVLLLQSHKVSAHIATVRRASHTQHHPLPVLHSLVDDLTWHGALCSEMRRLAPQSHHDWPHAAIVCVCPSWA